MPNTHPSLTDLIEAQRAFDAKRATTFEWAGPITAEQTHPLVHNALSLAGEAGEIANLVKKLDRGDFGFDHLMDELPGELADVMIYVMKIAYQSGIDLELAIRQKMNTNASRFPVTNSTSLSDRSDDALVDRASSIASRLDNERLGELADIYSLEGLTPPADADRLVAGALLALGVAKLAEFEGNAPAQESEWERLAPAANWLPISYKSLVTLARHDTKIARLMNVPSSENPAVA